MHKVNYIIQGISILCVFKYQVKANRQNASYEHMPLQMSVWLLMNLLLVSLLKIAPLPSYTETRSPTHKMQKNVQGFFFFFWNLGCIRWLVFFWLGFVLVFFCRIISADSVRLLLWIDGVENLKNPSDSSSDFLCPFN